MPFVAHKILFHFLPKCSKIELQISQKMIYWSMLTYYSKNKASFNTKSVHVCNQTQRIVTLVSSCFFTTVHNFAKDLHGVPSWKIRTSIMADIMYYFRKIKTSETKCFGDSQFYIQYSNQLTCKDLGNNRKVTTISYNTNSL